MDNALISLVLLAVGLLLVLALVAKMSKPKLNKNHFTGKWQKISQETNKAVAVIKADSLVDEALRHAKVKGETMGQRLNNSVGLLSDVNGTWSAHKLRNRIAHESDATPSASECDRALRQFKKALKDLGAL